MRAPGMGGSYRVKVLNGGWLYQPLAQGKGVRREAESEGSRRQSPDLRYTNPIRGCCTRVSLRNKVKPYTAKGYSSISGRYMG